MRIPTLILILFWTSVHAQVPASPHFSLAKLAEGVYAAIASDTGFAVCNAGIVDLGQGVLVFDPFISPRAAADLRQIAVAITGKPVIDVVNSHFHNDHVRGNQEFTGAHIISTARTRKVIAENEPEEIAWEKAHVAAKLQAARETMAAERDSDRCAEAAFWVKYYEAIEESQATLRTVLPDSTFEGKLVLTGSSRSVELHEMGRGHTESDLILWLPAEKIAFMGDLLFVNRHPYLPDGFPDEWVQALERIVALDVRTAVPGHGPVGNAAHLAAMIDYLKTLGGLSADLARQGSTDRVFSTTEVPKKFQSWWFSRFFLPNLKFMVDSAREHQKQN